MSKDIKNKVVPKLRFPGFKNDGRWKETKLSAIADLLNEKAGTKPYTLMSVTSGVGLISQKEKFGREIAGAQYKNYYVIKKYDFAYNKSATKLYPEGYIAMLKEFETGAVPNSIFTCFRIKDKKAIPEFLDFIFYNNLHGKWLRKFIEIGARAHGSLSVDNNVLFSMPLELPSLEEQQKIASCLSSLDDLITAQTQKLEALKEHKKGLMQQLFPAEGETVPKLRFPEFRDSGEWEEKRFDKFAPLQRGFDLPVEKINAGKHPVVFSNGILKYHNEYKVKAPGVVTGRSGTIGKVTFVEKDYWPHNTTLWVTDFKGNFPLFVYYYVTFIGLEKFGSGSGVPTLNRNEVHNYNISVPSALSEQQKIASCLSSLDELITAQTEKIEALKEHKKGLMQGLFPNVNVN